MPKSKSPNNKKANGAEGAISATNAPVPRANGTTDSAAAGAVETRKPEMKTAPSKKTRKPEIVKADSRSNLIPINLEDEIRRLAYLRSERRGFVPGHETEDWLSAEREVRERYHQHSA